MNDTPSGTRRALLAGIAGLMAAPVVRAGVPVPARVVWISADPAGDSSPFFEAFREGMISFGYADGRNVVFSTFWGDSGGGMAGKFVEHALQSRPDVIVTLGPVVALIRKSGTAIPTVFGFSGDPIKAGLVESLSRPGGHMTGISFMSLELVGKRLQLLKEIMPRLKRVSVLANSQHPGDDAEQRASAEAAKALGLNVEFFEVRNEQQLEAGLAAAAAARSEAVIAFPMALMIRNRHRIAEWSQRNRVPTISGWAQFAEAGNLLSYGPNLRESFRRLAFFVDRVLKGTKPTELPVELPPRVELVINMRAARALRLTIPQEVLVRADSVIE